MENKMHHSFIGCILFFSRVNNNTRVTGLFIVWVEINELPKRVTNNLVPQSNPLETEKSEPHPPTFSSSVNPSRSQ